ncbi:diguanylate cyclase [Paucisalibacillus sp. EB02]|uniref:diguanylate cyclase n=1 Tax=Paucisalibacillus sp. EB02 TaxID=1347087 RepID=UPI0004AC6A79|nr:diguanylate cyclase [Paucisalibacillus sp. EB02]
MEIINNRYRLIDLLNQDKFVSTYTVVDILRDNRIIKLNLLNSEYTPKPLVDFFAKRFISIKNLSQKQISKNYEFGVVSFIDNRAHTDKIYYFTSEYNEKMEDFEDYIQKLELDEIIERFIELCSLIDYIHMNGFVYGSLNPQAIQVVDLGEEVILKLKDLATITLEKYSRHELEDSYFQSPNVLAGNEVSKESDMYSLGMMLLAMIQCKPVITNPKIELEKLEEELNTYSFNDQLLLKKVLPIVGKLLMPQEKFPYENVQAIIDELGKGLGRNFSTIDKGEIEKLHFDTEIVGRDVEIEIILRNVESMIGYNPSKRIFFIQGDNGIGKTRLLQEINFLLALHKVHAFASFQLESSDSRNLWIDILQKIISLTDERVLRKYHAELVKYLPELERKERTTPIEFLLDGNNKYRLLNRIASFINESLQGKTAVFIIDDLHLADTFTMDLINYLSTNVLHQNNLMFILSGEVRDDSDNYVFLNSLEFLKKRTDSSVIRLNPLSKEQSAELIKHILSLSYQPLKLTERIFSRSYGNPLFIHEVLKDLYSRKLLHVSPENGMWSILLPSNDYNSLQVPESIEQALLNQLRDLTNESLDILKTVAVFNKPVSVRAICYVLEKEERILTEELQELLRKGILQELVSDYGYLFEFDNKVLKRIVYNGIDTEVKKAMHNQIGIFLEKNRESKIEELIFHYEGAENKEKSIKYYLEIAHQLHKQHEIKTEIQYLEKAVAMIDDAIDKTNLHMKISDLCLEVNLPEKALKYLNRALDLATEKNHQENILAIYLALGNLHATLYQAEQVKVFLQKVEKHFPVIKDLESRLEFNRLQAFLLGLENQIDEAAEILHSIIEESGDEFPRITGNAYLLLGFTSVQHNRVEEAIDYYLLAMNLHGEAGYMKGYLGAVNNIGVIYQAFMDELDTAMNYFIKVRDLSEEYGIFETEIRALSSIGNIYANAHNFQEAYKHFKHALQKAEIGGSNWVMYHLYNLMCHASAEMGNYSNAISYYERVIDLYEKGDLSDLQTFDFHNTSMNLYQLIGNFELANEFSDKVVAFNQGRDNIYSYSAKIYKNINMLRDAQENQFEHLISEILELVEKIPREQFNVKALMMAATVLSKRGRHTYTKPLIQKLENYLSDQTPDTLWAGYYYLLGMKENSSESMLYLTRGLESAKKARHCEMVGKILLLLGDYAFQENKLYSAAHYYLEGTEIAKSIVKALPEEYQLLFVNNHHFARGFIRLERIYLWLMGDQISFVTRDVSGSSILTKEKLDQILDHDYMSGFIEHQDFIRYISNQHMTKLSKDIQSSNDILKNVTANTLKNINMLLKFFAGVTIATRGLIITENHGELTVLSSTDDNDKLPTSRYILNRAGDTKEVFLVDDKDKLVDVNLLSEDLHGALCIPILQKQGITNKLDSILGYVYLETDMFVHNFNELGLEKCNELMGLLASMLEKHQLKLSATIDKLTGALTRKYLDDALESNVKFSKDSGESLSIIMFDLDRFKLVNDRYGHQVGDTVLRKVSYVVMETLEENHILGRYGGEEFIIILPTVGQGEALELGNVIRKKVTSQRFLGDKFEITISMGIATFPDHGQHVRELIDKVDQALYMAKETGRNNAKVWNRDFITKSKPQNKLSGILTGDDIRDSRNVLAMVELIQLNNSQLTLEDKLYQFLGRIIEISEAQNGYILLYHANGQKYYGRKAQHKDWLQDFLVDEEILNSVLLEERGLYTINWDATDKINRINGLPDWDSILSVPIMVEGSVRGAIYLSSPTRVKEFGADDLNMLNVYSNLLSGMI